jgi:hypothetical protein
MLEIIITIWSYNYTKKLLPICKQIKGFLKDQIRSEEWSTTQNTLLFIKYLLTDTDNTIDGISNKKKSVIDIDVLDLDVNVLQKKRSNSGEKKKTSLKFVMEESARQKKRNKSIEMESNNIKDDNGNKPPQIIEYDILNVHSQYEKELGKFFCESFFLAGLPKKDAKIINNSENYIPICGHKECSILPSFRPQILYRYPAKNTTTFELTDSVNFYII